MKVSPLLPPPPSSQKPDSRDAGPVDYLSGDAYRAERSEEVPQVTSHSVPHHSDSAHVTPAVPSTIASSSPLYGNVPTSAPVFSGQPKYDEPLQTSKSTERLPPAPWDVQSPVVIPPPPANYNQRQQFFEQQQQGFSGSSSPPASGSGYSYDGLVGQTHNLSVNPEKNRGQGSLTPKQSKPEDALFKDLVDFAKSKSPKS
ncbi:Tom1-like protein [Thalictrum thalictroides]|uniref:Tom1-like protein n=1 Tax=Thalictrum thalictroides TaxID=46969 RepID=A0A7J6WPN7_THATH|nr:Tom1-like protein [Thalictrum thalictroides]